MLKLFRGGASQRARRQEFRSLLTCSLAVPMVSGSAALLLSAAGGDVGKRRLRELLLDSAEAVPGLQGKVLTGVRVQAADCVPIPQCCWGVPGARANASVPCYAAFNCSTPQLAAAEHPQLDAPLLTTAT